MQNECPRQDAEIKGFLSDSSFSENGTSSCTSELLLRLASLTLARCWPNVECTRPRRRNLGD
ncbi:hypothetical protein [Glutamicibacter arilaitensis]|uniref:hypothetical protein n=1 Tax=Glutamicibacter arilaitensis TaxID=256701 RepID=UPI003FD371E7